MYKLPVLNMPITSYKPIKVHILVYSLTHVDITTTTSNIICYIESPVFSSATLTTDTKILL